ncbi:selenium metabolism-associated LysR family transcriptional regulator [Acetivibrio ethanolgignens]|uniref:LysR family transcriptional regulator n=1 Tax=Acetivibrio ethanolgignens TaxID=290052 RepID=A0A0V8QE71_9FIRM|nr:selenium metabolism-associated LysR family transcriptional regulator [Acetivibrio ethanolgignens]KSV58891.1 LysR family transcriptional regulator [Acetivibrio ethanolgignens]
MNLKQLEAFVHIADSGSFSIAARELFLTQPTISAHISSLERELNTRFFVRNTKEVRLSESGIILYDYAKQMIRLQKEIEKTFLEREEKEQQCIRIAASTIPAQYILPGILAVFSKKYPSRQFLVMEVDSAKVVEAVINSTADIGFTGTVIDKHLCKYIPFYQDELVIIAPNNSKFRRLLEKEKNAGWMKEEAVILREKGSGTRREAEKQLRRIGIQLSQLNVIASMESPEAIKRAVENGLGISIISKLAVQEEVKKGTLLALPISDTDMCRNINLVYNCSIHLPRGSEELVKVVKELYKKEGNV